jgi:1,2-diacylglycerol 3-alpha-glucosyltransferase
MSGIKPMRILVAADLYYPPTTMGGPIAARRWAHRLAARGHEVLVLAPSSNLRQSLEVDGATQVLRIPTLPIPHIRAEIRAQLRSIAVLPSSHVRRVLRTWRPDVVHVHFVTGLGLATLAGALRAGLPVLGTNHALPEAALYLYGRAPVEWLRRMTPRFYAELERNLWQRIVSFYNRCDLMTAPTATALALYRQHGLKVEVEQVSNGIENALYGNAASELERETFLAQFGIPADRAVVIYAGRLQPEKRVDLLLASFARIAETCNAHLLLAGGHDAPTEALLLRLGLGQRATVTGFLHPERELPVAYRASTLLASASECEGQGIVFLEAMASGLPVVAADRYAVRDTVIPGQTGLLFSPGNEIEMANQLQRLLDDPALRNRLGQGGRQLAATHDIEHSVNQLEQQFARLVQRRSRP